MAVTIGIDLGTSNSCAAYHDGRSAQIIETAEGQRTMPSIVGLLSEGRRPLTGRAAQRELHANPEHTFKHIKRVIGQEYSDQLHGFFQYVEGPNGEVWFQGPERAYSASVLSSYIIKSIIDAAERKIGSRPDGAVITVPASFDDRQQAATREAAIKAGLSVKRVHIMQEPAAAALAHGIDQERFATVAVYDLGGGTFYIAIMRCGSSLNRTLGLGGHPNLGGIDCDERLVRRIVELWREDHDQDLMSKSEETMVRVRDTCEQAKITRTTEDRASIWLDHISFGADGINTMNYVIERDSFVDMTKDLIDETIDISSRALASADVTVRDIDHVICVGGMTRIPAIQERVEEFFGKEILRGIVPEEAVAIGAATRAAMLDHRIGGSTFKNIVAVSTGVESASGAMTVAIPKGASLPIERTLTLTTDEDDQDCCSVHVVQGEKLGAKDNTHLMTQHVDVDPAIAGEASVTVDFKYDEHGALTIHQGGVQIYGVDE